MKTVQSISLISILVLLAIACSPTPVDVKFEEENIILEGADATGQIKAIPVDADGKPITEGVDLTYFCAERDVVKVDQSGALTAVASGEDVIEVEVVGTEIKKEVKVRVKIASSIETSHEKLRLWTGQVKKNVAAWVLSEKEAYVEGYIPDWTSDDPSVVSVKNIPDPSGTAFKRSYVEMKGMKSGNTTINATYGNLMKTISVRVYDEDEEVDLSGQRKQKKGEEKAE